MPPKRSRLMRSGSIDSEVVVAPPLRPPVASPDLWLKCQRSPSPIIPAMPPPTNSVAKPNPSEQAPPLIFSIPSPVQEQPPIAYGEDVELSHNFFEKCYFCNKQISTESEVFMYRDLRAFCSVECRERHMLIDMRLTKKEQASKRVKDLFGSRPKRPNAP